MSTFKVAVSTIMILLCVDTSSEMANISISTSMGEGVLGQMAVRLKAKGSGPTHSEALMPHIDYLLKALRLTIHDIGAYCTVIGPGSFTGLRIGISTVKGFSYATGKPIISITSFEALAYNFTYTAYPVCALIDARKNDIYGALFFWHDNNLETLFEPSLVNIDRFLYDIMPSVTQGPTIFTGSASLTYMENIIKARGEKAKLATFDKIKITPSSLAIAGLKKLKDGDTVEQREFLSPLYLKRPQAEEYFLNGKLNNKTHGC